MALPRGRGRPSHAERPSPGEKPVSARAETDANILSPSLPRPPHLGSYSCTRLRLAISSHLTAARLATRGSLRRVTSTTALLAMLQMVGGVSTIIPVNTAEFGWFFGTVLAGTVLFAAVQAVICGITVGDPDEVAWRQNYDALNFMMADSGIPHKSRLAVRTFFRRSRRLLAEPTTA